MAILGIDIGGVVIEPQDQTAGTAEDTSFFGPNYLQTPEVEGAVSTIASLLADGVVTDAWFVSRCGANTARKTREWLAHHDVWTRVGLPTDHIRFCRQRHEKAPICRELGITHFVDDRLSVLRHMAGEVAYRFVLRPSSEELGRFPHDDPALTSVRRVETWDAIAAAIRGRA